MSLDALVLGIFFVQTAIAMAALSTSSDLVAEPPQALVVSETPEKLPELADPIPEASPFAALPDVRPFVPERPRDLPSVPADQHIPSGPSFVTLFGDGSNSDRWHVATHSNRNHAFFGNDWSKDGADFSSEGLILDIDKEGGRWKSGEVKTNVPYGFGRYEVVMKPAKGSGLVSAFFTYTGPYFGDPHDEIDIEFVGNDTRHVEFNYFKNGRTLNHKVLDLPFDASEDFHLYAFEWYPEKIRWFIDNELVFETPHGDTNIPRTPGNIYMNMWTGTLSGLKSWHGEPDFEPGVRSEYACVSFTAAGEGSRRCSDLFESPRPHEGQLVNLVAAHPVPAVDQSQSR